MLTLAAMLAVLSDLKALLKVERHGLQRLLFVLGFHIDDTRLQGKKQPTHLMSGLGTEGYAA